MLPSSHHVYCNFNTVHVDVIAPEAVGDAVTKQMTLARTPPEGVEYPLCCAACQLHLNRNNEVNSRGYEMSSYVRSTLRGAL